VTRTFQRLHEWPTKFLGRHDELAMARQARIALLLIVINIFIIVLTVGTAADRPWAESLEPTAVRRLIGATLIVMGMLAACCDWSGVARAILSIVSPAPAASLRFRRLEWLRPFVFYPAVYLNVAVIGYLVHTTGGLASSPYTSLVYAFLLTAQQFSRYRRAAGYYLLAGVIVTLALYTAIRLNPVVLVQAAPIELVTTITVVSFAFAGVMTQLSKPGNPRSVRHSACPSSGAVYLDPEGRWRTALFSDKHVIDLVATTAKGSRAEKIKEARQDLERKVKVLLPEAGRGSKLTWKSDPIRPRTSFTLHIEPYGEEPVT